MENRAIYIERIREDMNGEYNTMNHPREPDDEEANALDYDIEGRKTNLLNYADIVSYPIAWSYQFTPEECKILCECADKGRRLPDPTLPKSLEEETAGIVARMQTEWKDGSWFFRFNSCSSKDGLGNYPITSPKQAIMMIITSKRAWRALCDKEDAIYFVNWDKNWDKKREFRVFVRRGKVTGISQYNPYEKGILSGQSNLKITDAVYRITQWLENEILSKVLPVIKTDNVTVDVYLGVDKMTVIEFNSFGYWQAAGSALFHWLNDKAKLYNTDGKIWVRIVK